MATPVDRSDTGYATLRFRPNAFGTFFGVTIVSFITALLLAAARTRLPQLDGATAATLLLAFPVVALGSLASPGEHSFATRLLLGPRIAALVVGVCALVVAGSLAGGFIRHETTPARAASCKPAHVGARHGAPRVARSCTRARPATERTTVPPAMRLVVDLATAIAGVIALVLLFGWGSTLARSTGRLPEAGAN
jgi:hypothetical protein